MLARVTLIAVAATAAAFALLLVLLPTPEAESKPNDGAVDGDALVIENARVFDGETVLDASTLVIEDGRITGIGSDGARPAGAQVIDANGMTALPGLIDAHTHSWAQAQREALQFGVTSMLDMFTAPAMLGGQRAAREEFSRTDRAALFSAGMLATVDGGHGTQFGIAIETISENTVAADWVAARRAEGSDYIKLVYIPGNPRLPSLDLEQATAIIDAAHAEGMLAVAHIDTQAAATEMLQAGIDGLVHVFADEPVSDSFITLAADAGLFVIPTLSIIAMVDGRAPGQAIIDDSDLSPYLSSAQRNNLGGDFGGRIPGYSLDTAINNVRRLHEAGITILAGSDAPNPGTAHGATLHHELLLLTQAGMTNAEALAAATSLPASVFSTAGRGELAIGARADIVLVNGDPTKDILATRAIAEVIRNGYRVARGADVATDTGTNALPEMLGDFDAGIAAPEGLVWTSTSDAMMGGGSTASASPIEDGAGGSSGAMRISATVSAEFGFPWAGAYLGVVPEGSTANIGGYRHITFDVRGTPASYRLMLFTSDAYGAPPTAQFTVGEEWSRVQIALEDIGDFDRGLFTGLAITTPMQAGDYRFDIDNVRLLGD